MCQYPSPLEAPNNAIFCFLSFVLRVYWHKTNIFSDTISFKNVLYSCQHVNQKNVSEQSHAIIFFTCNNHKLS